MTIDVGARVYLRSLSGIGEPGTVVRQERTWLVVHWHDLEIETRHKAAALELAREAH